MHRLRKATIILGVVTCTGLPAGSAAEPFFTGIGDTFMGYQRTGAVGVSADGTRVAGDVEIGFGAHRAITWEAEIGIVLLAPLNTFNSMSATAISSDGEVVVGSGLRSDGKITAYRWTAETGCVDLGDLPSGRTESGAGAVSADGSIVAGSGSTEQSRPRNEAFYWTAETGMVGLGDLPGGIFNSGVSDMSADGAILVGFGNTASGAEAMYWTNATGMVSLGDIPGGDHYSSAICVSGDGRMIYGEAKPPEGRRMVRWTLDGAVQLLHYPFYREFVGQYITDCSHDGRIVIGATTAEPMMFIWDAQRGTRDLRQVLETRYGFDLSGWTQLQPRALSNDGRTIVGHGTNPDGLNEGWVAYLGEIPPPCPGDFDEDAVIALSDLGHLLEHFGETFNASPADGDLDLDTDIDIDDLALLLSRFGQLCPTE